MVQVARLMAHRIEPEPRWRMWIGAAAEMAVLLLIVVFGVLLASVKA